MRQADSVKIFSDKYLQNISDAFKTLYAEEQLSDVTIHCKEGSIKAHKLILAANSPYFYKIFRENRHDYPILILSGIALSQLKNLMNLLYQGIVDIPKNDVEAMFSFVEEFEIKGVHFGQTESSNVRVELSQASSSDSSEGVGRDTRYKGQKRVAVDFIYDEEKSPAISAPLNLQINENRSLIKINQDDSPTDATVAVKREVTSPLPSSANSVYSLNRTSSSEMKSSSLHGAQKVNAWARKQRKFKCDLCPSSFKRSSHLSRHQLVHTGERPYSCNQCEKAFSRHDKLKHHIRKAHEFIPDSMFERIDVEETTENELDPSNRNYANLIQNGNMATGVSTASSALHSFQRENSPLFTISHITSILEDSFVTPPKKGRGRPRKYPPAPPQPIKRSRGRPRLNQGTFVAPRPGVQNYDITNLPYGDLNYLTSQSNHRPEEATVLEPLVEINTGQMESSKNIATNQLNALGERLDSKSEDGISYMEHNGIEPLVQIRTQSLHMNEEDKSSIKEDIVNISEIETKIGLIGECTISVAN